MQRPRVLLDAFCRQLATRPHRIALIASGVGSSGGNPAEYTWLELATRVATVVRELESRFDRDGLPRQLGHRSDNSAADIVVALACMATGAIEVPIDDRWPQSLSEQLWRTVDGLWLDEAAKERLLSSPKHGSTEHESTEYDPHRLGEFFSDRANRLDVDQASLILWTSGTTSSPKGVTLSHQNLVGNAAAKLLAVPQAVDDLRLTSLSLSHAYARTCDFGTWLLSGCILAVTLGVDGWHKVAPQTRPTLANVVPSIAERLLEYQPTEIGSDRLRLLGCGGAAMTGEAFARWQKRGVTIIQGYGCTEASPVICSATPQDAQPGWVGRPVEGWELAIRTGRLFVRGEHVMLGYWRDPDATAAKIDSHGWLDTRDLVEQDPNTGQLKILGRADDVLVLPSGNKLHPAGVEMSLQRLPQIRHALLALAGNSLELWLDADASEFEQRDFQDRVWQFLQTLPRWQQPVALRRLDPPPSVSDEELTSKGTLRRAQLLRRLAPREAGGKSSG